MDKHFYGINDKTIKDCSFIFMNAGHGHVWARPDGMRARCGGPRMCKECKADEILLNNCRAKEPNSVLVPDGYVLVPISPPDEWLAAYPADNGMRLIAKGFYEAVTMTERKAK